MFLVKLLSLGLTNIYNLRFSDVIIVLRLLSQVTLHIILLLVPIHTGDLRLAIVFIIW